LVEDNPGDARLLGEALAEIARECVGMSRGFADGELSKAKEAAQTQAVEAFSTISASAEVLSLSLDLGLPPDEPRRVLAKVVAAAEPDVESVARGIIRWEDATVVLVGDRAALEAELAQARKLLEEIAPKSGGLPAPAYLDPDGNPPAPPKG